MEGRHQNKTKEEYWKKGTPRKETINSRNRRKLLKMF